MNFKRIFIWGMLFIVCPSFVNGQIEIDDFGGIIDLDSIMVTASRQGFDVEDFITMVREDESFYHAFSNLRRLSYSFENHIDIYDKKGKKIKASYYSKAQQDSDGNCRSMIEWDKTIHGKFYKGKEYRYYTAKLYDRLFFTRDTICESERNEVNNKDESNVSKLKKLIFSPGEHISIPLIGKKTAIFGKKMAKYYDYKIESVDYLGRESYAFTATVKPYYQKNKKDKTVIKHLSTYFEKDNLQVLGRDYTLAYNGTFFDFDVTMHIELKKEGEQYIPAYLSYDGNWKVAMKKREKVKFWMKIQ